jgi:hypothetical protein
MAAGVTFARKPVDTGWMESRSTRSGGVAGAFPRAHEAISDRRLAQTIITALVLGFCALAVTAATTVWLVGRAQDYSGWVDFSA